MESAEDLIPLASAAFASKNYAMALALLDKALDTDPDNAALYFERAQSLAAMDRVEEALSSLYRAIHLRPAWAAAHYDRAKLLQRSERFVDAVQSCKLAIAQEPEKHEYTHLLAELESAIKIAKSNVRKLQGTSDDFECVLCMKLFYEPVTTPCGHTFCKSCLLRALDHGVTCPLCRSILYVASDYPVTIALKAIIERNFADEYERRRKEVEEEKLQTDVSMPLFILNTVAFPKMSFPMHIFEPRYRLMLRRCLEGQKRFGLVSCRRGADGDWVRADVGCILQIIEHRTLPNGRSYIDTVGTRRFRVVQVWDQDGYACGKVQYIDDQPLATDEAKEQFAALATSTRKALSDTLAAAGQHGGHGLAEVMARAGDIPADDVDFMFWLCAHLPVPQEMQLELLAMSDPIERLSRLARHVESLPAQAQCCIV